jgi:branched-chain amino acid transport system permease protein
VLAIAATLLVGMAVEVVAMRRLYGRDHLDHVLGTFGLILFFDELVRLVWGPEGRSLPVPSWLNGSLEIVPGIQYPAYRLAIIVVALSVATFLYVLVMRTRVGMLIRAGASNREMVSALGVNIKLLFTLIFGLGAALAALAGLMQAPILTVQIGMGESILILAFVITVIGGIGSIRGAFVAAMLVGFLDTMGRALFPQLLVDLLGRQAASTAAPALSSMLIYILMAAILVVKPEGLFSAGSR